MADPDDAIAALTPVLWWKLDEASGTAADNSGSAGAPFDGVATGAGFGATGFLPASTATVFDTTGGTLQVEGLWPVDGGTWVVGVWFDYASFDTGDVIFSIGDGDAAALTQRVTMTIIEYVGTYRALAITAIDSTDTVRYNQQPIILLDLLSAPPRPYLLVIGWDGTNYLISVNGVPVPCTFPLANAGVTVDLDDNISLTLGSYSDGTAAIDARFTHLFVLDYMLDAEGLDNVYTTAGFSHNPPPDIAPVITALTPDSFWPGDERFGTDLIDRGPQAIDLAISGTPCTDFTLSYEAALAAYGPGDPTDMFGYYPYNLASASNLTESPFDGDAWTFTFAFISYSDCVLLEHSNGLESIRVEKLGDDLVCTVLDAAGATDFTFTIPAPQYDPDAAVYLIYMVTVRVETGTGQWSVYLNDQGVVDSGARAGGGATGLGGQFALMGNVAGGEMISGEFALAAVWNSTLDEADILSYHALAFPLPPIEIDLASVDGYTPVTGPWEILVGPLPPIEIDLASVDGYTPVAGISVLVEGEGPGEFQPAMYAELWKNDVKISDLVTQSGVRFQDVFNDVGSGSLTIQLDDPDAALLDVGAEVRCYMFGQVVFTWSILAQPSIDLWSEGEEAAQTKSASGPGRASLLEKGMVYPPIPLTSTINPQHRLYTFASIDFPNATTWGGSWEQVLGGQLSDSRSVPIEYTTVSPGGGEDVVETVMVPAPNGWPVPDAWWIWGQEDSQVVGKNFFRKAFFISTAQKVAIMASADNYFTLYLDGTPLLGENEVEGNWKDYRRVDLVLDVGWHTFAAVVINIEIAPGLNNPAAFIAAITTMDEDLDPVLPAIIQTDGTWSSLAYPTPEPGWTPGQILIDAIGEAQARGALPGFVYDFTAFNDSLGNPWQYLEGFSVTIGSSVLDILKGLNDQGHVDWRVKPGGKLLQMFVRDAIATNSGVTYQVTGDVDTQELVSQQFVPQAEIFNRYLVKWSDGYFEINHEDSQALWGDFEGFMTIDAPSIADATAQAMVLLNEAAVPVYSIVCQVDPLTEGTSPYGAYGPGEKIRIVNPAGALTWYQVMSITVSQTESARPTIGIEANARLSTRQREDFELLKGLGRSIVGDTKMRNQKMTFNKGAS